jgi:CBS domain containing-hemolysin-like protein
LRFTDATAKEVMTPRPDVVAVSEDATVEEAVKQCLQSGHARLPAHDGPLDDVTGVFDIRELRASDYGDFADLDVADVVSPTLHVPESKNVDDLLSEMRDHRIHMAIVIDEFGAIEGLVTMEDLLEELVGEILVGDEDPPITYVDDDAALVDGAVNIHELNEALDIVLPEGEEFETIAGFIFNRAGRLVEQGEAFDYENVTLRVEQVENTRIQKVRLIVDRDTIDSAEPESPAGEDGPG